MCILVHKLSEIREAIGANIVDSKSFQEDFKMNAAAWFYNVHTGRRSLALQVKEHATIVDIRKLADKSVAQLTSFKISSVEFVFSNAILD